MRLSIPFTKHKRAARALITGTFRLAARKVLLECHNSSFDQEFRRRRVLESADKESADKRAISFGISGIEGKEMMANPQPLFQIFFNFNPHFNCMIF